MLPLSTVHELGTSFSSTSVQDQDLKQYLDRCNGMMSMINIRVSRWMRNSGFG